jgi:hypothetical protein
MIIEDLSAIASSTTERVRSIVSRTTCFLGREATRSERWGDSRRRPVLSQVLSAMAEGYLELLEGSGCGEAGVLQALDGIDNCTHDGGSEGVGHDGSRYKYFAVLVGN